MEPIAPNKPDISRRVQYANRAVKIFGAGGLLSICLLIGSEIAEQRAQASNEAAIEILSEYPGGPVAASVNPEFIDQNEHTILLGEAEHYLRLGSGLTLLATAAGFTGYAAGFRVSQNIIQDEQRAGQMAE